MNPESNRKLGRRSKLLVVGAFAALLAAFVATNVLSGLALSPQLAELQQISEDHAQAVALLSEVRGEVSWVYSQLVSAAVGGAPAPPEEFQKVFQLVPSLARVADTTFEQAQLLEMQSALVLARSAASRLQQALASSDGKLARAALLQVDEAAERFDAAAGRMVEFNATQVRDSSIRIARMQRQVLATHVGVSAVGLFAGLLLLAVGLATLSRLSRYLVDKEAFAARVAHDLRAPLQTIRLGLTLLARLGPGQDQAARERLQAAVDRMSETIDGLLDPSPIRREEAENGAAVAEVLEEVRADLGSQIASSGAQLELEIEAGARAAMSPAHLRVVLQNLLGNSLKFLREDGPRRVRIAARCHRDRVRIEVADSGIGIPRPALARIFEPGFRASENHGGHGIGLSTVKRLVGGCTGRVRIDSEEGRGTTVRIDLPAFLPRRAPADAEPRAQAESV